MGRRKNIIYGNCKVLSPDNDVMFLCTEKRAKWYLARDLAEIVSENPLVVRLLFKSKGLGGNNDKYSLSPKKNRCVVCGKKCLEQLTKHHIVAMEYRKFFPIELKKHSSHDIVSMCFEHHMEYEKKYAIKLKRKLGEKYNAPYDGIKTKNLYLLHAVKAAKVLLKHGDKIPKTKQKELKEKIKKHFKLKTLTNKDIQNIVKENNDIIQIGKKSYHGKKVMEQVGNLQEFVEIWRQDFVDSMKPKFLQKYWDIKRPINFNAIADKKRRKPNKMKKLIKRIRTYYRIQKIKKAREIIENKWRVIKLIKTVWSAEKIKNWNNKIIINSSGWLGGNFTEKDLKQRLLSGNSKSFKSYFKEDGFIKSEEYRELEKYINLNFK